MKRKLLTFVSALMLLTGTGCLMARADVIEPFPPSPTGTNGMLAIGLGVLAVIIVAVIVLIVIKKTKKK